jgi:hypothetical protein
VKKWVFNAYPEIAGQKMPTEEIARNLAQKKA